MLRAGLAYHAANGAAIPNLGQAMVAFEVGGVECGIAFQFAAVERPLVSVSKLVEAGHEVHFGESGGSIVHTGSGRRLDLERKGGVYLLKMVVKGEPEPPFARQEQ